MRPRSWNFRKGLIYWAGFRPQATAGKYRGEYNGKEFRVLIYAKEPRGTGAVLELQSPPGTGIVTENYQTVRLCCTRAPKLIKEQLG